MVSSPAGPAERRAGVPNLALRVELIAVALTFFFFALIHAGVGIAGIAEPRIVPATIVETLCGLAMAVAAVADILRAAWARAAAIAANAVSSAGVTLGIVTQSSGAGPTPLNFWYHRSVLTVLLVTLVLLIAGRVTARRRASA